MPPQPRKTRRQTCAAVLSRACANGLPLAMRPGFEGPPPDACPWQDCGEKPQRGSSYCTVHHRVVYRKTTPMSSDFIERCVKLELMSK